MENGITMNSRTIISSVLLCSGKRAFFFFFCYVFVCLFVCFKIVFYLFFYSTESQ